MRQKRVLLFFQQCQHLCECSNHHFRAHPHFSCHSPYCQVYSQTTSTPLVRFQVIVWVCLPFTESGDGHHTGNCFLKKVIKRNIEKCFGRVSYQGKVMLTEELLPDSGMSPSLSAEDIMDSVCYFWRPEASNESKSNENGFFF